MGLIVLTSTIGIINPLLIQAVFNKALFVPGGPKLDLLYTLVAIMAAVPLVNGAIGILQTYETTRVGQQVMRDLRDRLYSHLETLSLAFFTGTKTGEIQSRLYFPIGQLLQVSVELRSSLALFDRVFEYLDVKPDITDAPDAADLPTASTGGRGAITPAPEPPVIPVMTMTTTDVVTIEPLGHQEAMRLQAEELKRAVTLLRSLDGAAWAAATDCPGWDVRTMYQHVLGACEAGASIGENLVPF